MEKDEKRGTEHFRMDEFVYSAMAVELGLNNALPSEVIPAIRNLMVRLLEPLRIYHRQPMYIMSGYRSEELNRLVGGAPSSQHMKGEAVDIYTVDRNRLLEDLVASRLNFDQAILYRTKGFIHLSLKKHGVNRKQILFKEEGV